MITVHQKIKGEYRAILLTADERVISDSGWQPNLITNQGLINMFEADWAFRLNVGTNGTVPQYTNTSLGGYLAYEQINHLGTTAPVAPNYEFSTTVKVRYAAGVATGTLAECGFNKPSSPTNTKLSTRALLSPPITKAANQTLDIYYRFTRWPDIVDRIGVVNIDGVDYNYIVRGANLAEYGQPGTFSFLNAFGGMGVANSSGNTLHSGEIGTIESAPNSPLPSPWMSSHALTANGSGYAEFLLKWDLDSANGNIRSIALREAGNGVSSGRGWQIRLGKVSDDTRLVKDNTKELHLEFRTTWARI